MSDNIIVPAYFSPQASPLLWTRLVDAASRLGERLIVIANPNNGPGAQAQQAYTDAFNRITAHGGQVIGYVYTCYAGRFDPVDPPAGCPRPSGTSVEDDINAWYTMYPALSGIFFDQVSSDSLDVGAYQAWYDNVQLAHNNAHPGATGLVVFNPGRHMHLDYLTIGKALFVVFEGSAAEFFANWQPLATPRASYHKRSVVLLYETAQSEYSDVLLQVQNQHLGGLYVTDDELQPNPWDALPPYFEDVVKAVRQSCMRIVCGSTEAGNTNWQRYIMTNGRPDPKGILVEVDTREAGFTRTPIYTISLAGVNNHWTTTGGSSIYRPTPSGFAVYLKAIIDVTPAQANGWKWQINWIACGL